MDPIIAFFSLAISYLLGSISFARVIVKLWTGKDVTEFEVNIDGADDKYKAIAIGGNTVSTVLGAKGGLTVRVSNKNHRNASLFDFQPLVNSKDGVFLKLRGFGN